MANFIECHEHCRINSSRIVEESSSDLLDFCFLVVVEGRGVISLRVLCCCTVRRAGPFGGGMLWARRWCVMEFFESRCNVLWHGYVDVMFAVVPL